LPTVTSTAGRLDDQPVAGLHRASVHGTQLDRFAVRTNHALSASCSRLATSHAERRHHAVLCQQGQLCIFEKHDLTLEAVAASPSTCTARPGAHAESLDTHRVTVLENLRVRDARVGHVRVHGARAVVVRTRATTPAQCLVVAVTRVAEDQVVHRTLAAGGEFQRLDQRVHQPLACLDVPADDGGGRGRVLGEVGVEQSAR
jgi:hypothetical protein